MSFSSALARSVQCIVPNNCLNDFQYLEMKSNNARSLRMNWLIRNCGQLNNWLEWRQLQMYSCVCVCVEVYIVTSHNIQRESPNPLYTIGNSLKLEAKAMSTHSCNRMGSVHWTFGVCHSNVSRNWNAFKTSIINLIDWSYFSISTRNFHKTLSETHTCAANISMPMTRRADSHTEK